MNIGYRLLIIKLLLVIFIPLKGQVNEETKARVDNIDFFLKDSTLVISYDISNAKSQDRFDLQVKVVNASTEQEIEASTFFGDIYNQSPGKAKTVYWELSKDINYLDDNIYVQIDAIHLNPITIPYNSKKKAYLQSTAFPGWGTSKICMNKAHLAKGVASYALIGLSVKANYDAVNYYDKYLDEEDKGLRDSYFSNAENNYRNSFFYAGGAALIWLAEYLWIYIAPNKTDALSSQENKISLRYKMVPEFNRSEFVFSYNFSL